jgi:hypothetical protein
MILQSFFEIIGLLETMIAIMTLHAFREVYSMAERTRVILDLFKGRILSMC